MVYDAKIRFYFYTSQINIFFLFARCMCFIHVERDVKEKGDTLYNVSPYLFHNGTNTLIFSPLVNEIISLIFVRETAT